MMSQKSDTANPSSPGAERPAKKRLRQLGDDDDDDDDDDDRASPATATAAGGTPILPEKMWALVMDILPYESVLNCAAVSRSMLRDTMPLVTMLHLDGGPAQLNAGIASSRYRDVRDVYVYSLLRCARGRDDAAAAAGGVGGGEDDDDRDGDRAIRVDADAAARAVPFLCHLPRLERVFLGGIGPDGCASGFVNSPGGGGEMDEDRDRMTAHIDAFSGAFRARALSADLWVLGLRCPRSCRMSNVFSDSTCLACHAACRSFPLGSVADFECEGSSCRHDPARRGSFYSERLYGLDVCLKREAIEDIIVRERPGGRDLLHSESRFLVLLGRGTRRVVVTDDGVELFVVKYRDEELSDLRRCIKYSRLDVGRITPGAVLDAVRRSFAEDERDPAPPRERCYLAQNSFYELRGMGLSQIDESSFLNADEWDGIKHESIHAVQLYSHYNWRFT
jgi:hypothetical protein